MHLGRSTNIQFINSPKARRGYRLLCKLSLPSSGGRVGPRSVTAFLENVVLKILA